jgi:hypothetical protein
MSGLVKKPKTKEPNRLAKGKKFETDVRNGWLKKGAKYQKRITKPSGRKGRIDIFVDASSKNDKKLVAVVEIKASDWDSMALPSVRRNVRRQANQIWDYIDSQIEEGKHISPGVVFKKMPKDPERLKLIEEMFEEQCIAVSWEDESIEERKARS